MLIHYERTLVTGTRKDEEKSVTVREELLHRRSQDPLLMACRRNGELARCQRFTLQTTECFNRWVDEEPARKKSDIPVQHVREWEYDDV